LPVCINRIGMADKSQFAREEIFEGDEFLVALHDGIGAFFPRQTDAGAKTVFQTGALMAGTHDARPRAGDDHPAGCRHLSAKFDRLPVFRLFKPGAGGAKNGNLAFFGVRLEKAEGVAQFPHRRADNPDVSAVFNIGQQLEGIINDVGDQVLVIAAAFVENQLLDAALKLRVNWGFEGSVHYGG
jgi:hypothetical protein